MSTGPEVRQSHDDYSTSIDMPVVETGSAIRSDAPKGLTGFTYPPIFVHRIFTRRFNAPGVNRFTAVMVSLTEVFPASPGAALDVPGIADATMKVYNVAPRDGGQVDVRGEVDWDSDIPVRVSILF